MNGRIAPITGNTTPSARAASPFSSNSFETTSIFGSRKVWRSGEAFLGSRVNLQGHRLPLAIRALSRRVDHRDPFPELGLELQLGEPPLWGFQVPASELQVGVHLRQRVEVDPSRREKSRGAFLSARGLLVRGFATSVLARRLRRPGGHQVLRPADGPTPGRR
jgi:hypothetical protein